MAWPYQILDALCADVDIRRVPEMPEMPQTPVVLPAEAAFWSGAYARVAFWPAAEDSLTDAANEGEAWLDDVLTEAESSDRPVDGYLVIGLPAPPGHETVRSFIRSVELSTIVCRKQVVWPCADSPCGWRGLAAVSVLGFPDVGAPDQVVAAPELDPEAAALWERIERLGFRKAVDQDREGDGA
ncbi:hypothetical protein [Methylorubrum extorquens]|uniref:Uncharacterized protein n=1 Tax=Methylorubrum extorquens TaxID=408 RepID=A0AAX3WK77_METEX|nr:hypothetical protein [Methylorubrum extorquens]WHQ71997.1 hypothetical protein KEC54_10840 [Methylorubrum extorquens]